MVRHTNIMELSVSLLLLIALSLLTSCSSVNQVGRIHQDQDTLQLRSDERIAGVAVALSEPDKRCNSKDELTDEVVAKNIGLSAAEFRQLKIDRNLATKDICAMPAGKLARIIYKSQNPAKSDGPQEWASFRALQQADENGFVKPSGHMDAINQRKALIASVSRPFAAGISQSCWTSIGPGNIGGRVRSIVIHPTNTNNMWAGSVSGGIWKTTDGGSSWSPVNDFMGNLAVSTMVIDPSNPNIMYAGTGEGFFNFDAVRGYGIFKSIDGGNTWTHLSATTPNTITSSNDYSWYYVNRIAISSSGVLLAGNSHFYNNVGGIYRSTDGGVNWTLTFTGNIKDVLFDPNNSNNALANAIDYNFTSRQYSSYIMRSTDAGQTWTKVKTFAGNVRVELAYAKSNSQIAYASVDQNSGVSVDQNSGDIYKSINGGLTWTLTSTPAHLDKQGSYGNAIWVSPTDPNLVVIGGIDLYRSTDGGSTWTQISRWQNWPISAHPDHHAIIHHPNFNGTANNTVFFGNDGGIWTANDVTTVSSTSGWTNLNNSLAITQFFGGAGSSTATPSSMRIIGGTQDNGHLMYTGSTLWARTRGGDGGFAAVDPTDSNYMYGEYTFLDLYRSTTGGSNGSYNDVCNGILDANKDACGGSGDTLFIAPFILDPNNANTMLAGGASLWRSTNVKAATPSWSAIKSAVSGCSYNTSGNCQISAIAVATGNSNIVWVGYQNGAVYYTINGTAASPAWTLVSSALPARYVGRIMIDKDDSNKVYVTFGGYSADNIYMTTNSGTSWTNLNASGTIPSAPIRTIVRHNNNPNWLYIGTEVGIFTSEDGGTTWTATNDGPANVSVDELFWYSSTQLVAATHGRSMFICTVGGGTCTYIISPTSQTFTSTGGTGSITVAPSSTSCAWTASSALSWVTITSGASGTGSGTVTISVSANTTGASRTGNLTIGGQTFTVTQAGSTTAQYTLTVTKSGTGNGTVNASIGALTWSGNSGTANYNSGTSVTLTAAASTGSTFTDWSGACTGTSTSTCTVIMNTAQNVTATFTLQSSTGTHNLPKTGQTKCYDTGGTQISCAGTGQDGEIQAGIAWPSLRFTDNGNSTITDNLTGLIWTKDAKAPGPATCNLGVVKTWQEALNYAACLNTNSYLGYNDWRLPNVNELRSLINFDVLDSSVWLNTQGFINTQADSYWSSTTYAYGTLYAWDVYFGSGVVYYSSKSYGDYVRCVRGGQTGSLGNFAISLPKTGQTKCYDTGGTQISCAGTGQDGAIQAGTAWPIPRFTDNGNSTITDNLTGLIWTQDANAPGPAVCNPGVRKTWQEALNYAACLNTNSYLGYNDWRLPNVNELRSLINFDVLDSSVWLNTQGFINTQSLYGNWSSTTSAWFASYAWVVNKLGDDDGGVKADTRDTRVCWPVRGGQSGSLCNLTISPFSQTFTSTGGTGTVTITASASSCAWTASSALSWVTITSGSSGTGNGTVTIAVSANTTGAARTGNITIAGQTFMITQSDSIFADVASTNVFYSYINAIYNNNPPITVGCSQNPLMYCPDASVTRGQMAAFIIRAKYGENSTYTLTPYFSDVPATNGFFKYVQKMKDAGITSVTGTYDVNGTVTRGQMAAFIIRAKYGENFTYTTTPYFSDVPETNVFFKYVQKMKDAGITSVTGSYNINGTVNRGAMAAFIARAFLNMP